MRLLKNQRRVARRGATAIEVLFSVSSAALLALFAILYYNNAASARTAKMAAEEFQLMRSAIRAIWGTPANYGVSGDRLDLILASAKTLPRYMTINNTYLVNIYGGSITINAKDPGSSWGGATSTLPSYIINSWAIPLSSCVSIISKIAAGNDSSLLSMRLGDNITNANAVYFPRTSISMATLTAPGQLCDPTSRSSLILITAWYQ